MQHEPEEAEWELVADLYERIPGQRGTPVHYSPRDLVNAYFFVLRTGCAWRLLPETCPPLTGSLRGVFALGDLHAYLLAIHSAVLLSVFTQYPIDVKQ